jgi:hypothetical protein
MKVAKSLGNSQRETSKDQGRRTRGNMIRSKKPSILEIPLLMPQKIIRVTRRFYTPSAISAGQFSLANGHSQFLVAITAAAGYCLLDEWRINKVSVYGPFDESLGEGSCSLAPTAVDGSQNFFNERSVILQDSTGSRDRVAYVSHTPSRNTPMGSWHVANTINPTGNLFLVSCTPGGIMDIEFDILQNYAFPLSGFTVVLAGASIGTQYGRVVMSTFAPRGVNAI